MRLAVTALLLLAGLVNAEASSGVCARSCAGGAVGYDAGLEYHYLYEGSVSSRAAVAGEEESRLAFTAKAIITANTACDLKLQVRDLVFDDVGDEDGKWFTEAVQEHDLHFSYQQGAVTHLCPHDSEEAVATNFKRGILSALQMTVTNVNEPSHLIVDEVDVSGRCDTSYTVMPGPVLEVTKAKQGCRASSFLPHLPHSHFTNANADSQLPFFRSNQTCQMFGGVGGGGGGGMRGDMFTAGSFGEGVVWQQVKCTEEVKVGRPLSPGTQGSPLASLEISSKLVLDDGPLLHEGNFSKGEVFKRREPLLADLKAAMEFAEMRKLNDSRNREQLDVTLETLAESMTAGSELEEERPRLFSSLVEVLNRLQEEELEDVWETYSDQETHRRLVVDGAVVCETAACVSLLSRLARERDSALSTVQLNTWLAGLHLHSSFHPSSIDHLLDLAEARKDVSEAAVMAASSVVHRVCQHHPDTCPSQAQSFLKHVEEQVGDSCGYKKSKQDQEHIKLVLRALGNAGILPDSHFPERCYMNKALLPELRIAALQSYRRTSCRKLQAPWKILEDGMERSEVRVAAYLALVPCAAHTAGFFTRIQNLLLQEEVQQVYSFIWTHVKNLADHPGPSDLDQELSKLARQHTLPNKFNSDAFRSSGNYRYAQFSDMLNLGGSLDTNIIYSEDSYVPHQVSANLTLDLLDNSFNFLDFGGEFSGIENLIESYFGKDGYFGNEDVLSALRNLRPKRNIIHDDKIEDFQKQYDEAMKQNEIDDNSDEEVEEEPKASFYLRMFGNEVVYMENLLKSNPTQLLYRLLQELSTPKTFKIIDQEYMTPTHLGFPLRLKLNATGSVSLKYEYTFSTAKEQELLLEGSASPSVVVALDETLLVDGFVSSSGLRRTSTQVAKTHFGGRFSVESGQITELQINIPSPEVTKVSSSVKVALLKDSGSWVEPATTPAERNELCTPESFSKVLGLSICNSLSYGTYEVDGETAVGEPYNAEFKVTKTDTFNYYKLYMKTQDNVLEALFDTPGSATNRKVLFLFNFRPDKAGGYIVIRGIGYGIKGQYENSDSSKELVIEYLQASKVLGSFKVSLQKQEEDMQHRYVPEFSLTLGSDQFTLGGHLLYSIQEEHSEGIQADWELEGIWHKVEESRLVTQVFGTVSGSLVANQEKSRLYLSSEYGTDRSNPHAANFTLDATQMVVNDKESTKGYISVEITQAAVAMDVAFEYQPDLIDLNTNASLQGTEVASRLIAKNVVDGTSRDSQVSVSLFSKHLEMDYSAAAIYKKSDNAFQAEAELNVGSSLKSKFLVTFLLEDDPLHVLTGVHATLNEFMFEVGSDIDMTQPDHALITMSTTLGEATAGLTFEADYGFEQPFNTSLELYVGHQAQVVGVASHTTSDPEWHHFTGSSTLKWFEWSASVNHEVVASDTEKSLKLSLEEGGSIEINTETSPRQMVQFLIQDAPDTNDTVFLIGAEKLVSSELSMMQVNLTAGASCLLHLAWKIDSGNMFNFGLHMLESELSVDGNYHVTDGGTIEGAAQARVMVPSGQALSSNLSLSHVIELNEHHVLISASSEDGGIEGQLRVSQDGWFGPGTAVLQFSLTTPLPQLHKFEVHFNKSVNPHHHYSAGIELDELKIRGEARLSDPANFLAKLEYEGGEECGYHLHLHHARTATQYLSGASLALPHTTPWEFELNTTLDHSVKHNFLDAKLSAQAPLMATPFMLHGMYNITDDHVQIEILKAGEKNISISYSGRKEMSWKRNLLHGLCQIETPWTEPLAVNMTYDHTWGLMNVNVDFQSSWDYISSWVAEFSSNYSSAEDTKAHFYLIHSDLQITMDLQHNQTSSSLKQQLEGKVNTFTITYSANVLWDKFFAPTLAKGRFSLFNFFDHSLDLTLLHTKESGTYKTEATGTLDDHTFTVDHKLERQNSMGWSDSLEVKLGDTSGANTGISLSAITHLSLPDLNSTITFTSPWTDSFSTSVLVQEANSSTSFKFESFYSEAPLLHVDLISDQWPTWDHSNITLQVTSSYFDEVGINVQHSFDSGHLVSGKVTYGSDFLSQVTSHLKLVGNWFSQEFLSYNTIISFSSTDLDLEFKTVLNVNSQFDGELELQFNDYSLFVESDVLNGKVFHIMATDSTTKYQSELKYELGIETLFSLYFTVLKDEEDLLIFITNIDSISPKFQALATLKLFGEEEDEDKSMIKEGNIDVFVDLANIHKGSLQGTIKIMSSLPGLDGYGGQLDVDVKLTSGVSWRGLVNIFLLDGSSGMKGSVNSSLEVSQALHFEHGMRFEVLDVHNETLDLKELSLKVMAGAIDPYELRMTIQPNLLDTPWSLAIICSPRYGTLKGFLTLDSSRKYELSLRLSTKTFTVDLQQVDEEGSEFQIVQGNVNWILKRTKQLVTVNMNSDIPAISKITGQVIVQQKQDVAVTAKLKINDDKFNGNFRINSPGLGESSRLDIKIENSIIWQFDTDATIDFALMPSGFTFNVRVDLNGQRNWIMGNLKFSIPESYLKLKTPFSELDHFLLAVRTEMVEEYGLEIIFEIPQLCWNVTGHYDVSFFDLSFNTNMHLYCGEEPLFDIKFQYNIGKNPIVILCELTVLDFGLLFRLNGTGKLMPEEIGVHVECEVYPAMSLGLSLAGEWSEQQALRLYAYDIPSNASLFIFENFLSESKAKLNFELPQMEQALLLEANYDINYQHVKLNSSLSSSLFGYEMNMELVGELMFKDLLFESKAKLSFELPQVEQTLLLEANCDIQNQHMRFNSSLSSSLFGHELNMKLLGEANIESSSGNAEVSFTSNTAFTHVNMSATYDFHEELTDVSFKLLTPLGDADGELKILRDEDFYSITADITSSLHTFQKYRFRVVSVIEDGMEKLTAMSAQGDHEFHLKNVKKVSDKGVETCLNISTPFEGYENFEFNYIQPKNISEIRYQAKLTVKSSEETYVIEVKFDPDDLFCEVVLNMTSSGKDYAYVFRYICGDRSEQAEIIWITPELEGDSISFLLKFDLDGSGSAVVYTPQGLIGIEGSWHFTQTNILLSSTADLTFFNLGEYNLDVEIPLQEFKRSEIKVACLYPDLKAEAWLEMGEYFRNGNIGLNLTSEPEAHRRMYSFSYDYQDSLALKGHFDKWQVMLKGRLITALSGHFEAESNIPGYEAIDGTWDVGYENHLYFGQATLDVQRQEVLSISSTLDIQSEDSSRPWESVKLNMLLESPLTWTHHLHAEYQLRTPLLSPRLVLYYQHGLDTFQVQLNSDFGIKTATLVLTGNIPVEGISTFTINLNYNFLQSYSASIIVKVEETTLQYKFDISPDWGVGSLDATLTSPFIIPVKAQLRWSLVQDSVNLNGIFNAGMHDGKLKASLDYTKSSADFECHITSSFEEFSQFVVAVSYKVSSYKDFDVSVSASLNNHLMKIKSMLNTYGGKLFLKLSGFVEAVGARGMLEVDLGPSGAGYAGSIHGKFLEYEKFAIDFTLDLYQFKINVLYNSKEVLIVHISYSQTKIQLKWTAFWTFSLVTQHKSERQKYQFHMVFSGFGIDPVDLEANYSHRRKHQLHLSLTSSLLPPLSVQVKYTGGEGNLLSSIVKLGEKTYRMNGRANIQKRKSSIDARFESSVEPNNPIVIRAKYDLTDFLMGRMTAAKELAQVTIEWEGKTQVNVTGLRSGDQAKVDVRVQTPHQALPHLHTGFRGEFFSVDGVGFNCTAFVEWSQRIEMAGFVRLTRDVVDLNWTLMTTFSELEKLSTYLQLHPGQVQITIQFNDGKWKAVCDYAFSPFSISCELQTPVSGLETILLFLSFEADNGKMSTQFELSWPEAHRLGIQVNLERWHLEISYQTPWEPFISGLFTVSLKTEGEKLTVSSVLQLDQKEIEVSLVLLPTQFQFLASYEDNIVTVGLAKLEYAQYGDSVKVLFEMETPYEKLRSLKAKLHHGNQNTSLLFEVNEIVNTLEGMHHSSGGKFIANIPLLSDFNLIFSSENAWLKANIEVTFSIPQIMKPYTISMSYDVQPQTSTFSSMLEVLADRELMSIEVIFTHELSIRAKFMDKSIELQITAPSERKTSMDFKLETPGWKMESLSVNARIMFSEAPFIMDTTLLVSSEHRGKHPQVYNIHVMCSLSDNRLLVNANIDIGDVPVYKMQLEVLLSEFGFTVRVTEDGKEMFTLIIEAGSLEKWQGTTVLAQLPMLGMEFLTLITHTSLTASLKLPQPSGEHTLMVTWPEQFTFDNLKISAEVKSSYLPEEILKLSLDLLIQESWEVGANVLIVYGGKEMLIRGLYHYNEYQLTIDSNLEFVSDWIGNYFLEINVDFSQSIMVMGNLKALEEEHFLKFHLDVFTRAVELNLQSPWLPLHMITYTGKVSGSLDFTDTVSFTSKLKAGDQELDLEAGFENVEMKHINSFVVLKENSQDVFTMNAVMYQDEERLDASLSMFLTRGELKDSVIIRYYDRDSVRFLSGTAMLLDDEFQLTVIKGGTLGDLQSIDLQGPGFQFLVESDIDRNNGAVRIQLGYDEFDLRVHRIDGYGVDIKLKSTFVYCEALSIQGDWYEFKHVSMAYAWDGRVIMLAGDLAPDDIFGYTLIFILTTPFEGYEKYSLVSPHHSGKHSGFMLEYPGGKVGVRVSLEYNDIFDSDFVIGLYLPLEKYEVISLQYRFEPDVHIVVEARIGKIGFTYSVIAKDIMIGWQSDTVLRLNDFSSKSHFQVTHAASKRFKVQFDSKTETEVSVNLFHAEAIYETLERFFFMVKDKYEELLKVHVSWGEQKILTLLTPKTSVGFLHLNLECGLARDDYLLELGLTPAIGWLQEPELYALQLHQEVLQGGRHLFLLAQGFDRFINVEGTLSANSHHFNNSLIFGLNDNFIGYKALVLRESAFLYNSYASDVQFLVLNRTLHHQAFATASSRNVAISSTFTWNEQDQLMPPIKLNVNYNDHSLFGNEKHCLKAVLTHPDVKDVILRANITRTHNSPLSGSMELVDENSPESKLVAVMEVQPAGKDRMQNAKLELSQPASNLSLLLGARLGESGFADGHYHLKYWSLTSETWHQMNISTAVATSAEGHIVTVAVVAPERDWGYTCMGALHDSQEAASVSVEGRSRQLGDSWKFGSVINKHLPELLVYLNIGQEDQGVHEEGRLRIGVHSPVEVGATLHHQRFGEWYQDGAVGLRLMSPHILQMFLDFDPSLDYESIQDWAHLFSPARKVYDAWREDLTWAVLSLQEWAITEAPAVIEALVHNETLQAVYQRETSNWEYLVEDVESAYSSLLEDAQDLWLTFLLPALDALQGFALQMYKEILNYLSYAVASLEQALHVALQWLEETWFYLSQEALMLEQALRELLLEVWAALGEEVTAFYNTASLWATQFSENVSQEAINFKEAVENTFSQLRGTIEEYLRVILAPIQPFFDSLAQSLQSYAEEALDASGPCWQQITDKMESLASLNEGLGSSVQVLVEFVQADQYYSLAEGAWTELGQWALGVWNNAGETLTQLSESFAGTWATWQASFIETLKWPVDLFNTVYPQLIIDGVYPTLMAYWMELQQKVASLASPVLSMLTESAVNVHSYLLQFSVFDYIDAVFWNTHYWISSAWQRWSTGDYTNLGLLDRLLFLLADAIENCLTRNNYFLKWIYEFDPWELGLIRYNQYLPVKWASFMELPRWAFPSHVFQKESAEDEAERLLAARAPEGGPGPLHTLMIPDTATATIAGQHVTTFDLRHYQFLGSCSYLLVKDFEGGDLEIIGVYQAEAGAARLKAVVVHGQNTDVTLGVDGSITSTQPGAKIYNGTDYCALKMPDVLVTCSRALRGCTITVSGKYFNRLGGLLGNYNREASDDLQGPGGQVARDSAHLASMWAVSPTSCYQTNQANTEERLGDVGEENVRECSRLFLRNTSPFRDCFNTIDPQPYFNHCIVGQRHPAFTEKELNSPCTAVSSYRTQCWAKLVRLPDLNKCRNGSIVGCIVNGKEVPAGWKQVYEASTQGSADVALVIELARCNAARNMPMLLEHLSNELARKRINDVHYSVVAVKESETVTKTFLNKRDAAAFLDTLTYFGPPPDQATEAAVIATAEGLGWRPGVSRTIIHLGCRTSKGGERMAAALHQNDVTYHLVAGLRVAMAGSQKEAQARTRKLFGFDEKLVYISGDFKNFRGSKKLRLALRDPKDEHVNVALSTGGSIFNIQKWTPKKAIQGKKFLKILSERVALSSSAPACQECQCQGGGANRVPTCHKCFSKAVFYIPQLGDASVAEKTNTVAEDIKRKFEEEFMESNNSTRRLL